MAKTAKSANEAVASPPLHIPSDAAERFFKTFEKSARRWEMIIYPGMIMVVLFMAYGFYLIFNLTNDMRTMVARFDDPQIVGNLNSIATAVHSLSSDIHSMTSRIETMAANTTTMSKSTGDMTKLMESIKYMRSMDAELKNMNKTMYIMGGNVNHMSRDMAVMNRSFSRPMNMMNSVMPF